MPPLHTRIFPKSTEFKAPEPPHLGGGYYQDGGTQLSAPGNIAPIRSLTPVEYTYDFQTERFNPDSFLYTRGSVDVNTPIRNLALQAAQKAGLKVT